MERNDKLYLVLLILDGATSLFTAGVVESEAAEVALEASREWMDNFPVLSKSPGLRHGFPSPRFSKILLVPRNETNCHRTQDTMAEQSRNGSLPFRKTTCSYDQVPGRGTIPAKPYLQELGSEVLLVKKRSAHHWRKNTT